MNISRLLSIGLHGVALDTETAPVTAGELAPKLILGSVGAYHDDRVQGAILSKQDLLEMFCTLIEDPDKVLLMANGAFDLAVIAKELKAQGIDCFPEIFAALEAQRIYDLQHAQALDAVAGGHLGKDPRTGTGLINPETGRRGRYSLSTCVSLTLDREDAKANDEYRLRYDEFDGVPIEQLPAAARQYPIDDGINQAECSMAQVGHLPRTALKHTWTPQGVCEDCGATSSSAQCWVRKPIRNLHDLSNQVGTAFALHMGAIRGFEVNQEAVDQIEEYATRNRNDTIGPFIEASIIRSEGTENRSELKRLVAVAYGASGTCSTCAGTGKVPSPASKPIRCSTCRGRSIPFKMRGQLMMPTEDCHRCKNTGQMPNPRPAMITCFKLDSDGKTRLKTCDGTGMNIESVPRSEKDGIAYGADVLHESGDDFLMSYGDFGEDAKDLNVYIPYLRTARVPADGHLEDCEVKLGKRGATCLCPGPYQNIPLTLRPNIVLETGRVSYDGVIQLFKRAPGVYDEYSKKWIPSLRETIRARAGYVFSSEDFKAGELFAHGQSCVWLLGYSDLADALLKNIDPHAALAASVLGVSYDEFVKRKRETKFKYVRQASKPFTFGKPTGMSSQKVVLQNRKQGPNTPCPGGPSIIDDGDGNLVPGYKGMRFCIMMDGASSCGRKKVTKWGKPGREKPISPTCLQCLECAEYLGDAWTQQWRENRPYFNVISDFIDNGMVIKEEALERWPHLREVYSGDQRLAPGEIMQHVSGRIRGGLEFCAAANSFFQALVGDISKSAVRRVSRECLDHTVVVPSMAHSNSKKSAYGGGPSPLFGSHIIGFFHDELFLEHPESMGHDGATRVSEIMVEEMGYYLPYVASAVEAEPTLMRAWSKNAEKVVDASGRLIPWEPKH